jgi:long-chain fatty acid transport protein
VKSKTVPVAVIAAVVLSPLEAARAAPQFELVGGALGPSGLSARATGADASSAYFNPARLAKAEPGLQLGWFVLNDAIELTLFARDPAFDVPVSALNEFEGRFPPVPTEWLANGCDPNAGGRCVSKLAPHPRQSDGSSGQTRVYQVFGLVSEIVPRWLNFGIYGMFPLDSFMQGHAFFVDEREQYFTNSLHPELYSDRLTAIALAFGASSQVLDWLALGVGVTLSLTNTADAGTYVGDSAHISETLQLSTEIEVSTGFAPNFGAVLTPLPGLEVSLVAHAPQKMEIVTGFSTFLPNGDLQRADRTATLAYEPWKLGLGVHYDFLQTERHQLGGVATATYTFWGDYVNRQNERPLQGYAWANSVGLTFGVRHTYVERLTSGLDLFYEPSPVPAQTGRTNYVDNDRLALAASINYGLPLSDGVSLRFGLNGQVHVLPERAHRKLDPTSEPYADESFSQLVVDEWIDGAIDNRENVIQESFGLQTNNPGWPGFSSQGMIFGGGLNVSLLY